MAAVHEDRELDFYGPSKIVQGIHGGADGPAAEEDIIDKHNGFAVYVEWDDRWLHVRSDPLVEVVAMHADIQAAGGCGMAPNAQKRFGETLGQGNSAALDANENDLLAGFVTLRDFVSDTGQGPLKGGAIEDNSRIHQFLGRLAGLP